MLYSVKEKDVCKKKLSQHLRMKTRHAQMSEFRNMLNYGSHVK